jgi:hypothetical protein
LRCQRIPYGGSLQPVQPCLARNTRAARNPVEPISALTCCLALSPAAAVAPMALIEPHLAPDVALTWLARGRYSRWMRSRAARSRLPARGLAALLALIVCSGALDWGHAGGDDPDCNPVLLQNDHAADRFAAAPPHSSQAAEHCYICHSLRLLHTTLVSRGARAVPTTQSSSFHQVEGLGVFKAFGAPRSSRAPPATV